MIRLLQITDSHLFADPGGRLLGQNTRTTFEQVLALAQATLWPADAILLSGDLVHDERAAGYSYLRAHVADLATPCHAIPGNHDSHAELEAAFPGSTLALRQVAIRGWDLILLDSTVPGEDGGHLTPANLSALDAALVASSARPALICLHHQAGPIGSAWIDTMALDNAVEFFAVVEHHPRVRCIVFGHIHQDFDANHGGLRLLGAPSTSIQFRPASVDFAIDDLPPGLRWFHLHPDGGIETGIARLAGYPDPIDLNRRGY